LNDLILNRDYHFPNDHQEQFRLRYLQAISAYNTFAEREDIDEAFSSLSIAYEIGAIHDHLYGKRKLTPPKEQLLERLSRLCHEMRRGVFESIVEEYLRESASQRPYEEMTSEDAERFARTFVSALDLLV
jgi:hypothetical protein